MTVEIIDAETVRKRLPMRECIDALKTAMTSVSEGTIISPQRIVMPLIDGSGYLAVMPGSASIPLVYGAKIVSLHPTNPAMGRPAIQGFVLLFDHTTGAPIALVDGAEITAIRTAAASALATSLLATADATTLGLLGCGVQASKHLEAVSTVRSIEEVRVWGRSPDKVQSFVSSHRALYQFPIVAVETPQLAARSDIVCVVTGSGVPIVKGEWVAPGAHVNLVGAHSATTREADTALIVRSLVYVDSLSAALVEAGDLLIPLAEGAISRTHVIGEIGALILGRIGGRTSKDQITVYKSLGLVAQDLFAAYHVLTAR